jgi:glycosyltransferase involved in cell wall biosynthesis
VFGPPGCSRQFEPRAIPTPTAALPKPLVSCIMPTADRRDRVAQAIRYFQRQDYPELELVIVDDGHHPVRDLALLDERIRYVALPARMPVGHKRNVAIQASRGAIIAHWDDDDWYGPARISAQVEPILQDVADLTALDMRLVYDAAGARMWAFNGDLHARLMHMDMHCGTLVYQRSVWERLARFRSVNLGEDVLFVQDAFERGARLLKLPARDHFVYVRHAGNTWPLACGRAWDERAWEEVPVPEHVSSADGFFA